MIILSIEDKEYVNTQTYNWFQKTGSLFLNLISIVKKRLNYNSLLPNIRNKYKGWKVRMHVSK